MLLPVLVVRVLGHVESCPPHWKLSEVVVGRDAGRTTGAGRPPSPLAPSEADGRTKAKREDQCKGRYSKAPLLINKVSSASEAE